MSTAVNWPALSFLEHLRPGPGETVELALLSSYSADLGSIGAALLALACKDSEAGGGSTVDFVEAVELLRGKVRVVIQRGRLARMPRTPRMAAVLDQFVREVDFNEARHSWHAKVALLRLRREDGSPAWRLWVGSRNLTECSNRDLGLLLVSDPKGTSIPGAEALAHALAKQARLKGVNARVLAEAVGRITWRAPPGVKVECIQWSDGCGMQALPKLPENIDELVVVSPFIDRTFLAELTPPRSRAYRRVLLSTLHAIESAGPSLPAFDELLALDAPDYPAVHAPDGDRDEPGAPASGQNTPEDEAVGNGLHAKLMFIRGGKQRRVWLGSANATMRAWSGRNVEVMVRATVNEQVEQGLQALLGSARPVAHPTVTHEPDAAAKEEALLEIARSQVAARWSVIQSLEQDRLWLEQQSEEHPAGPHPDQPGVMLEVGPLCGALVSWPVSQPRIEIEPPPLAERSDFVRLRVSSNGRGLCWLQRAATIPELGEGRDRAAFVHFLGTHGFLRWLAAMLAEESTGPGEDWRLCGPTSRDQGLPATWEAWMPTLEDMLGAWARDPAGFQAIEQRVSRYLPALLERARNGEAHETLELLRRFEDLWRKLRRGLGITSSRSRRQ
ncbi:hypothetical protein [Pseudomonas asplenii]|uniref:hypothetical protein n=1 Tax=Pseudomonas asplenii TaxID=53407 RepID=UPI000378973A|nr:hypothetical protein [Pseudomonas fuscovaginae]